MNLTSAIEPRQARHRKRLPSPPIPSSRRGRPEGATPLAQSKFRFELAAMHALVRVGASRLVASRTAVSTFYSESGDRMCRARYIEKLHRRIIASGKISKSVGFEHWIEVSAALLIAHAKAVRCNRERAIQMIEDFLFAMKWGEHMKRLPRWASEVDPWLPPQTSVASPPLGLERIP